MPLTEGFYRQLTTELLQPRVKHMIEVTMKHINTGAEAKIYAASHHELGWSYELFDGSGRVGVFKFRGTEVALFYQRQFTNFKTEDIDPVPTRTIQDPNDAWIRIELFHTKAAKKRNVWFVEREIELMDEVEAFRGLAKQRDVENDQLHSRLTTQSTTIAMLKRRLNPEKKIVSKTLPVKGKKK